MRMRMRVRVYSMTISHQRQPVLPQHVQIVVLTPAAVISGYAPDGFLVDIRAVKCSIYIINARSL